MGPPTARQPELVDWLRAADATTIEAFLDLAFPAEWDGIRARILESGATFSSNPGRWAPGWTPIPFTVRIGRTDDESRMRSIFYRVHDCLHQLWGLPHPHDLTEASARRSFKRAVMCGEVAVLTLTEFVFAAHVHARFPELREWIDGRCAVPLMHTLLRGKTPTQVALRLDEILHKQFIGAWAQNSEPATAFATYYTPMLAEDRARVDVCIGAMAADPLATATLLETAPRARFGDRMNGMELTAWMIADFEHQLTTSPAPDQALVDFNRDRRSRLVLPAQWP